MHADLENKQKRIRKIVKIFFQRPKGAGKVKNIDTPVTVYKTIGRNASKMDILRRKEN